MSAGTVALKITGDTRLLKAQLDLLRIQMEQLGRTFRRGVPILRYAYERREAEAQLAVGRAMQALDPRVDVQVVTTNEGRCRVMVRQLGGWA